MCALVTGVQTCALPICADQCRGRRRSAGKSGGPRRAGPPTVGTSRRGDAPLGAGLYPRIARGRTSDGEGKGGYVGVEFGGRRIFNKKYNGINHIRNTSSIKVNKSNKQTSYNINN